MFYGHTHGFYGRELKTVCSRFVIDDKQSGKIQVAKPPIKALAYAKARPPNTQQNNTSCRFPPMICPSSRIRSTNISRHVYFFKKSKLMLAIQLICVSCCSQSNHYDFYLQCDMSDFTYCKCVISVIKQYLRCTVMANVYFILCNDCCEACSRLYDMCLWTFEIGSRDIYHDLIVLFVHEYHNLDNHFKFLLM